MNGNGRGRPLIGITGNLFRADDPVLDVGRPLYPRRALHYGEEHVVRAVNTAGGIPLLVPVEADDPEAVAAALDGLILSGGVDIHPPAEATEALDRWPGQAERDAFEVALYHACVAAGRPVLGICRGCQLIGVAEGGTLWHDIPSQLPASLTHRDQERYDRLRHTVSLEAPSLLSRWLGSGELAPVASVHHQAIRDCPPSLRITATAPDGVIEAVERSNGAVVVGVQWHPEWMPDDPSQRRLLSSFVASCATARS